MADNTTLPTGAGGDSIRTKDLTSATGAKTQIVGLDIGGESAELQVVAGQQPGSKSIPVVLSSDPSIAATQIADGLRTLMLGRQYSEGSISVTLAFDERYIPVIITDGIDTVGNTARPMVITPAAGTTVNTVAVDPASLVTTQVTPMGETRVASEPAQLFAETWDTLGAIDTVNKWTFLQGSVGNPSITVNRSATSNFDAGSVTISSGTVAGGWAAIQSVPYFAPTDPGWLHNKQTNNFEFPLLASGYRFWGVGILNPNPTIASPLQDGFGWEITTTGQLVCVAYASGARNVIATPPVPADASPHRYYKYFRGDNAYFMYDTLSNTVGTMPTGALGPNVNTMPVLMLAISNGGTAVTITNNGVQVSDTAHNTFVLADGALGFRKATVKAAGVAPVAADTALVVTLSPNGPSQVQVSNIPDITPVQRGIQFLLAQQLLGFQAQGSNGFVPMETPSFLGGL